MNDWTIFQYSIQMCIGNTIYNIAILSMVVQILERLRLTIQQVKKLYDCPWNYIHRTARVGNHMALYMIMDDGTILKHSILRCIGNTIHSVVV